MELHIGGREYSGDEAATVGLVNQAFPADELDERVNEIAERMAQVPSAVLAVNKRYVYTALEARGARSVIRTAGDLQAGPHMQALLGGGGADLSTRIRDEAGKAR